MMIKIFILNFLTIMSNFSEVCASGGEDGHSGVAVSVADVDDSG